MSDVIHKNFDGVLPPHPDKAYVARTRSAIEQLEEDALQITNEGSQFPGMSYEDGILAVIQWLTQKHASHPLDD